jgi:hypothetical protein
MAMTSLVACATVAAAVFPSMVTIFLAIFLKTFFRKKGVADFSPDHSAIRKT